MCWRYWSLLMSRLNSTIQRFDSLYSSVSYQPLCLSVMWLYDLPVTRLYDVSAMRAIAKCQIVMWSYRWIFGIECCVCEICCSFWSRDKKWFTAQNLLSIRTRISAYFDNFCVCRYFVLVCRYCCCCCRLLCFSQTMSTSRHKYRISLHRRSSSTEWV